MDPRTTSLPDTAQWPLRPSPLIPTLDTQAPPSSDDGSILYSPYASTTISPLRSRHGSDSLTSSHPSGARNTRINLNPSVTISFVRGSRLFKMRYSYIDVCKDASGDLKALESGEYSGLQGEFVHTFPNTRRPIPHLERPTAASQKADLRVSFLDEQTVQTANTVFSTQPHYSFESEGDCLRFQEVLLNHKVVFTAGIAEAKSKGRGEEGISQNLRVLRATSGSHHIVFFANSQRKEKKRYISVPFSGIELIEPARKAGRPIVLRLRPNNELLTQMKQLSFLFLDDTDQRMFYGILSQGIGVHTIS